MLKLMRVYLVAAVVVFAMTAASVWSVIEPCGFKWGG